MGASVVERAWAAAARDSGIAREMGVPHGLPVTLRTNDSAPKATPSMSTPNLKEPNGWSNGFDARWRDVPDFINGITHEIWEGRNIHALRRYYGASMAVRSPASIVVGSGNVIGATMATLAEFPDRQLLGEDVIWCPTNADGEDDWPADVRPESGEGQDTPGIRGSFLSSHRLLCTATHARPGQYGAPSGKRLRYRILADCAARDNAIYDEWLVRDQGAIVRQIGWDPKDYAVDLIEREGGPEQCVRPFHPSLDRAVQYRGIGNDDPTGQRHVETLARLMDGEMSVIRRTYARAAQLELPGHRTEHGREAADEFWIGLRSAFPDAVFAVHHAIGREDAGRSPRSAVRWSLTGKHSGWGAFGTPTGAEVHVMGISHAEWSPDGLAREWTLYDETAVWKQIALATG